MPKLYTAATLPGRHRLVAVERDACVHTLFDRDGGNSWSCVNNLVAQHRKIRRPLGADIGKVRADACVRQRVGRRDERHGAELDRVDSEPRQCRRNRNMQRGSAGHDSHRPRSSCVVAQRLLEPIDERTAAGHPAAAQRFVNVLALKVG